MINCLIYDFGYYFSKDEYDYYNRYKVLSKHLGDWQLFNRLAVVGYFPLTGILSAFYHASIALSATKAMIGYELDFKKNCSILIIRIILLARALFEFIGVGLVCLIPDAIATAMRNSHRKSFQSYSLEAAHDSDL